MTFWPAVLIGAIGSYLLKLAGFLVPASWLANPNFRRAAEALPLGLLGALVATQTFATGQNVVIDGRLLGLAVGAIALRLRASFVVVVVLASVVTAIARALGWVS